MLQTQLSTSGLSVRPNKNCPKLKRSKMRPLGLTRRSMNKKALILTRLTSSKT